MDYDNPQFIAAVKNIVRHLFDALKQDKPADKHAETNAEQNNRPRRVISAELATPVPITVHTKSKDKKTNWDKAKTTVEIIGIAAAVFYAYMAVRQWRELIYARHQTNTIFEENKRQFKDTLEQMKGQTKAQQDAVTAARESLEVSQRAYLIVDLDKAEFANKKVMLLVKNVGHIPPSNIRVVVHEATVSRPPGNPDKNPTPTEEMHWTEDFSPGWSTVDFGISVRIPHGDEQRIATSQQKIFIVGMVTYNDGFPNTENQKAPFCWAAGTRWNPNIEGSAPKQIVWGPCDWRKELAASEQTDKYPSEKYHTKN
jgi:hypothetical protein